ncbi:MAG: hypothetical protein HY704_12675 [Gemmatimonadetes bacterium]|nr:hypothetical protein [Gemmatimonadota bacterium]
MPLRPGSAVLSPPLSGRTRSPGNRRAGSKIVYAKHEKNYCARCQTKGKLLRDRARLLREDWPATLEEL